MTKLKIWGRNNSMNVQKAMWAVGEVGVEYERLDAGLEYGIVNEPWFGDLNPNRTVPVLDDAGFIVWESNVVIRYLATKYSPGRMMPSDIEGRAELEMWMDWQQTVVMPGLGPAFVGLVRTPAAERDYAAINHGADIVREALELLDKRLAGRDYVQGEAFTAADIALGCVAYRWLAMPVEHGDIENVRAWYQRLTTRPAFAEHVMLPLT